MNRGTIVRFQRQRAGLSIAELAEKADISIDAIEDIESNLRNPKVYELEAMAAAMFIPYWYLGDKNPTETRVYTYTHGTNVYDEQGNMVLQAEQVKEKLIDYLEIDEYLEKAKKDGLMND